MTDGDQALADKPGLHGEPPEGGEGVLIFRSHESDIPAKLSLQQSQNPPADSAIQAQAQICIVIDFAGGFSLQAPARLVIELVRGGLNGRGQQAVFGRRDQAGGELALLPNRFGRTSFTSP